MIKTITELIIINDTENGSYYTLHICNIHLDKKFWVWTNRRSRFWGL